MKIKHLVIAGVLIAIVFAEVIELNLAEYTSKFWWDYRTRPLDEEERKLRDALLVDFATDHFRDHYSSVVKAIRFIYGWDLLTEQPWKQ